MTSPSEPDRPTLLLAELRRFVRLRWLAGFTVVGVTIGHGVVRGWSDSHTGFLVVGASVLACNVAFRALLRPDAHAGESLRRIAWAQLLLDLGALTVLILWTGGVASPLLFAFVFHMVLASLLLPRPAAYAAAGVSVLMVFTGLQLTGQWPWEPAAALLSLGWIATLLITIFLTSHITGELEQLNEALRRQQQAMIQHEKMAALGQMAAGLAHEVSNPLASMDGLLQLIERHPDRMNPDTVKTLREQVARIVSLVRRMKDFTHPIESAVKMVPVNRVVEGALEMIGHDPRVREVDVVRNLDSDAGEVYVMPDAIQQVIVNLFLNSLDAVAGVDEPRITVSTRPGRDGAVIEVADNGCGIEAANLGRVFEPFFTTKPVGEGTGLGLSISYSLVERNKGRLEVSSRYGKGATFSLHLPGA